MVINAAGKAINKLILNLSFNSQPNDCVAAIVVSEIIDKLSPNIAPPSKEPVIKGNEAPLVFSQTHRNRSQSYDCSHRSSGCS